MKKGKLNVVSSERIKPESAPDAEIEHLRALLAGANQARQPTGVKKFFHQLAERLALPQKRVIMDRIREAPPRKKDAA